MNTRLYKSMQIIGLVLAGAGMVTMQTGLEVVGFTSVSIGVLTFLCGQLGKWFNDA